LFARQRLFNKAERVMKESNIKRRTLELKTLLEVHARQWMEERVGYHAYGITVGASADAPIPSSHPLFHELCGIADQKRTYAAALDKQLQVFWRSSKGNLMSAKLGFLTRRIAGWLH